MAKRKPKTDPIVNPVPAARIDFSALPTERVKKCLYPGLFRTPISPCPYVKRVKVCPFEPKRDKLCIEPISDAGYIEANMGVPSLVNGVPVAAKKETLK